jgi:hypothetical protein
MTCYPELIGILDITMLSHFADRNGNTASDTKMNKKFYMFLSFMTYVV